MELTKATQELPYPVDHASEIKEIKERTEVIMRIEKEKNSFQGWQKNEKIQKRWKKKSND
ncbi:hypothetical protein JOC86_001916 [Bacillus pakistanensis]|uniref:Uncharacterized protein n=1 Tax=Rossellomorea pakistanensis TaxID=992288 RepID=A0ABS2NBZ4_9BACI|nr:hypothetical protein [Bacillus pakistanensis]MBM7585374.1 hypothetical protein [Bacillus pakistanensis]